MAVRGEPRRRRRSDRGERAQLKGENTSERALRHGVLVAATGRRAAKLRAGGVNMMTRRRDGSLMRLARPGALDEEHGQAAERSCQHNRRDRPRGSNHVLDSSAHDVSRFA
jgi:hypothetical protein